MGFLIELDSFSPKAGVIYPAPHTIQNYTAAKPSPVRSRKKQQPKIECDTTPCNFSAPGKKRAPKIEHDTPLIPEAVARAVLEEAAVWLKEPLPQTWVAELTTRANQIYAHNHQFRRLLRRSPTAGRDYLWAFTRHWLAALLRDRRPHLRRRLPDSYASGEALF